MNPRSIICLLSVSAICFVGIGVGFAYSAQIETQNTIQSEWCTVIPNGYISISEDHKSLTTPSITYTDSSSRSGLMTITFKIEVSEDMSFGDLILAISSTQLGNGTIGSCILKSSDSVYIGIISGLRVSSGIPFTVTGHLSSGFIDSVSMDITVYPEVGE